MCSFYGYSLDDIDKLKTRKFLQLKNAIDIIEMERVLIQLNVADYPNMKKEDRKKFYNEIKKRAYPNAKKETVSGSEMARKLREWQMKK